MISAVQDFTPFAILGFDLRDIPAVALCRVSRLWSFLTQSEFDRGQEGVPECIRQAFMFEQIPAVPADYYRAKFCLLGEYAPGDQEFPFPDGRNMSEAVKHTIRKWAELPPCQFCGAVLLRGMPIGLCCRPFEGVMRDFCMASTDGSIIEDT
jgi:hypothetical protein